MTQAVYGIVRDCGDGYSTADWFRDEEKARRLVEDATYSVDYGISGGEIPITLHFPDDLNLEDCGFVFNDDQVDDVEDVEPD